MPLCDLFALAAGIGAGGGLPQRLTLAYVGAVLLLLALAGAYRRRICHGVVQLAPPLSACMALPLITLSAFGDSAAVATIVHRLPLAFGMVLFVRAVAYAAIRLARSSGMFVEPTLILGAGQVGVQLAKTLESHPQCGLVPVGFLDRFSGEGLPLPVLGDIDALDRVLDDFEISRVIVAFGGHRDPDMVQVLRACSRANAEVHVVPRFFELGVTPSSSRTENLWGIPVVRVVRGALRSTAYQVKRAPVGPIAGSQPDRPVGGTVSVVIPAVNEALNIGWVLQRIPDFVDEVVLVDGASVDDTVAVAMSVYPKIRVVADDRRGKGAALRAGFAAATGDYIVMIDADGSMDPMEIGHYLDPFVHGYDYVKGSRYMAGGGSEDLTWLRRFGNFCLLTCVNFLFGSRFSDLCYGFCAFRRDCLAPLALNRDGFEIETEMTIHAVKAKLRIAEVPSLELCRRYGQSNLRTFRDGQRVLRTLLRERLMMPLVPAPSSPPTLVLSEGGAANTAA